MRAALLLSCLVFASLLALLALLFYGLAVFCPHACI